MPSLPSCFSPLRSINSLQRSQICMGSPGLPVRAFNNPSPDSLFLFSTLFRDKSNTSARCLYSSGLKPTTHLPTRGPCSPSRCSLDPPHPAALIVHPAGILPPSSGHLDGLHFVTALTSLCPLSSTLISEGRNHVLFMDGAPQAKFTVTM